MGEVIRAETRGVAARPRVRVSGAAVGLGAVAIGASAWYAAASLLLHLSFRSYGWDLGIFDQVVWSISQGDGFHYSFRDMSYLGDHFQPVLVLLAPLAWLGVGPIPLLAVQGMAFGLAVVPLHAAVRAMTLRRGEVATARNADIAAWAVSAAYLLSLGIARADTYDFHPECFAPLLAFTALWGLASGRPGVFAAATLGLLPLKEDMAFLALAMCWVAWLEFGERSAVPRVAVVSVAYWAVVTLVVMPALDNGQPSPVLERYAYLGDTSLEIVVNAVIRPDLVLDHLLDTEPERVVVYLLAGVGFLPLLKPRLLPPLALLVLPPLLALNDFQQRLLLHYGVVATTFLVVLAAMVVAGANKPANQQTNRPTNLGGMLGGLRDVVGSERGRVALAGVCVLGAVGMFAWKSPLPPSFAAEWGRFEVDHHSSVAETFVDMVPGDAVVSAQASFVPHLSQRHTILEFPRVESATHVLVDAKRDVPGYDWPGYEPCREALPSLGFELERAEDGIELWVRGEGEARRFGGECG